MSRRATSHKSTQNDLVIRLPQFKGWSSSEQKYRREILLLLAIGASAFFYIALFSFNPSDSTTVSSSYPAHKLSNAAGQSGAFISAIFIRFFGCTALLLPLPLVGSALQFYKQQHRTVTLTGIVGWALMILCLACSAQALFPIVELSGVGVSTGGSLGEWIYTSAFAHFGGYGLTIIGLTLFVVGFILSSKLSLVGLAPRILNRGWQLISYPWNAFVQAVHERSASDTKVQDDHLKKDDSQLWKLQSYTPPHTLKTARSTPAETAVLECASALALVADDCQEDRDLTTYAPPSSDVLRSSNGTLAITERQRKLLEQTADHLTDAFAEFGISGQVIAIQPGPVVTVFEFQPDAGTKIAKILGLIDDIALALRVESVLMHPVKGKRAIGVQVPNTEREPVYLGDIVQDHSFLEAKSPLTFGMGKSLAGDPVCADMTAMPHLLMAGATGAGKSVAINSLLCGVIMKAAPADVRMILVDPKMLELSVYDGIPHLLMPVITDPAKASTAIRWAVHEMERRYRLMQIARVRHISGFNDFWARAGSEEKENIFDEMDDESITKLPYILVVIDELADLMLTAPKDVESSIQRLAQKARASGIHLVLATQRPSVDIITGVIKANLPCRVAFQTVSKHDSRTILDQVGSEKLLGKGDMLFMKPGTSRLERIQGALIEDQEVLDLVASVKRHADVRYDSTAMSWIDEELSRSKDGSSADDGDPESDDPKYDQALELASQNGAVSASFLQRHLKIGYNRAARMVEIMEAQQLVAKADGARPRKWLGPSGASY